MSKLLNIEGSRILCVADVRGGLTKLNELANQHRASCIIHIGTFGFLNKDSIDSASSVLLRHLAHFSPLIDPTTLPKEQGDDIRNFLKETGTILSDLPEFIRGDKTLNVPVYTLWGSSEDVRVVEKFAMDEFRVHNLHVVGLSETPCPLILSPNGTKIRLLGLSGAFIVPKLLDHGISKTCSIGGTVGATWSTLMGVGELLCYARDTYSVNEIRIFLCHNSPLKEELLCHLAHTIRADYVICGGLHFFYGLSFNQFAVTSSFDTYITQLCKRADSFGAVWNRLRQTNEISNLVSRKLDLLDLAANVFLSVPRLEEYPNLKKISKAENDGLKNSSLILFQRMWFFNLPDMPHGHLLLYWNNTNLATEMHSSGFDLAQKRISNSSNFNRRKDRSSIPTGPSADRQSRERDSHIIEGPGVWIPRAGTEKEIKEIFPSEFHNNITNIVLKPSTVKNPFSMIFFDTEENADKALAAINEPGASRIRKDKKRGSRRKTWTTK